MGDFSTREAVEQSVASLAGPIAAGLGVELVGVVYTTERGRRILRVYIDRAGGVGLDDCTEVSRELSTMLDVEDVVAGSYTLEVSSPGIERPLFGERDFRRFIGSTARIRTVEPVGGRRNFKGAIDRVEGGSVWIVETHGVRRELEIGNIARARLVEQQ